MRRGAYQKFPGNFLAENFSLILTSFLILFLELLLIRLLATEIRIFAYLSNLLLLGIFIGSGIGMLWNKRINPLLTSVALFAMSVLVTMATIVRLPNLEFRLFSGITELLVPLSEAHIWGQIGSFSLMGVFLGLGLAAGVLGLVAFTFVPLGQLLGRYFDAHRRPLVAYSVNIAASIAGMWAFQAISLLQLPPILGIILVQVLLLALIPRGQMRWFAAAFLAMTITVTAPKTALQPYEGPTTFWSPYQKLTLSLINKQRETQAGGWYLEVNNVGYMGLLGLSPDKTAEAVSVVAPSYRDYPDDLRYINQYQLPFSFVTDPQRMLIIGAGGGNDVAAAVGRRVPHIDAVEIDPMIVSIGRKYHPDRPYESPTVHVLVDDGRAVMQRSPSQSYDLVVMSLADSQTLGSSLTNLRLDHYLYTVESFSQMRRLLTPDGVAVISFEVQRPWIGARIRQSLKEAFGSDPEVFEVRSDGVFGWGGILFVVGRDRTVISRVLAENPSLSDFIRRREQDYGSVSTLLTDDWPYLYLDKPRLPLLHILFAALLVGTLLVITRRVNPRERLDPTFFLLGAGFLLFEFQNISKSSLLFGSTWITNLLIITAFLGLGLVANMIVERKSIPIRWPYIGLVVSLMTQILLPLSQLNRLAPSEKTIIAPLLMSIPVFFSGMIFATLFARSKNRSAAFASNLLGMAVGGTLEMLSFLVGIQALLFLTLGIYLMSWGFAARRSLQRRG